MLSQFFIKLKNHQKSIQLWSSVAIINLLFFNRKSIFKFLKPFFEEVKTPPKSILTMGEIYIKQRQEEFLNYINNNDIMHINKNINKEFYNKEAYKDAVKDEDNELEKEWRRKILVENTPRGNVYMFYDSYKLAFSYYSDTNISYSILNAVAMKYCKMFKCADFFVDQNIIPLKKESPLIKIHHIEEKKKQKNKDENKNEKKDEKKNDDDAPFAKLKNYNVQKIKEKKNDKNKKDDSQKIINKITNKFILVGKTYQMNLLPKEPVKKSVSFESQYLEDLKGENNLQKAVMSWQDYKNSLS